LIERIAKVHARQQVHYTINRGVRALDYGTPDDYADCFTAEAVYEGVVPDGSVQRSRGTAELRRFAAEFKWPPGVMRHWLGCTDIEIDGDSAKATSLKGALGAGPAEVVMRMVGRNADALSACPDGRWRFASRLSEIISRRAPK
jgi:hypothetical protein